MGRFGPYDDLDDAAMDESDELRDALLSSNRRDVPIALRQGHGNSETRDYDSELDYFATRRAQTQLAGEAAWRHAGGEKLQFPVAFIVSLARTLLRNEEVKQHGDNDLPGTSRPLRALAPDDLEHLAAILSPALIKDAQKNWRVLSEEMEEVNQGCDAPQERRDALDDEAWLLETLKRLQSRQER